MEALASGDMPLIDKVIADDHRVNAMEVEIDRELSGIIARRQPTARDLRLLIAVSKTIANLERVGDEAVNIAERTHEGPGRASSRVLDELIAMSEDAQEIIDSTGLSVDEVRPLADGGVFTGRQALGQGGVVILHGQAGAGLEVFAV